MMHRGHFADFTPPHTHTDSCFSSPCVPHTYTSVYTELHVCQVCTWLSGAKCRVSDWRVGALSFCMGTFLCWMPLRSGWWEVAVSGPLRVFRSPSFTDRIHPGHQASRQLTHQLAARWDKRAGPMGMLSRRLGAGSSREKGELGSGRWLKWAHRSGGTPGSHGALSKARIQKWRQKGVRRRCAADQREGEGG